MLAVPSCPMIKLDDKYYKLVDKMEALTDAPPSLIGAKNLTVKGPVKFVKGVVIKGNVTLENGEPQVAASCCIWQAHLQCLKCPQISQTLSAADQLLWLL